MPDSISLGVAFKNITKSYNSKLVLESSSSQFRCGTFSLIIGKNGSGKSTLLRVLSGAEAPDQGTICIEGRDLFRHRHQLLENMFFVSEAFDFTFPQKIRDMPKIFASFYPRWSMELYNKWLSNFKLNPDNHFKSISRGQKMQVVFSLALASRAKYLFIDEITAVLDAHARHLVLSELRALSQSGHSILLATNLVSEIHSVPGAYVYFLRDKKLRELPQADLYSFAKIRVAANFQSRNFWSVPLSTSKDSSKILITSQEELRKLPEDSYVLDRRENTLEEYFLYHSALIGDLNEKAA